MEHDENIKEGITQEEALVTALKELGGRAPLERIYPQAMNIREFGGNTPESTIRCLLQRSKKFRPTEGKRGWWELISYQEEIAVLKDRIATLEKEVRRLNYLLEPTPMIEWLANYYMDKYIKADKEDRKDIRNRLAKIKADLNIRVSDKVEARLQSFVTDFPFADNNMTNGTAQTNELLRGIDEKIGYIAKRPTIGTIVMEQRNFEKLLEDE